MSEPGSKQDSDHQKHARSEMRVVVEVDGNPVGYLNLDLNRLWPLISHRNLETAPVQWVDAGELENMVRTVVFERLLSRLQTELYQALGNQIVKAELDVESVTLRIESAARAFGDTKTSIEKLVARSDGSLEDFYAFFWEYVFDDRDVVDLQKEWKTVAKKANRRQHRPSS